MGDKQSIELPVVFYDSKSNAVASITRIHCNETLVKTVEKYNIIYRLNGGKNSIANPIAYTKSTATITLKPASRTGYTFVGWYSDSKFKTKVSKIVKGSTGKKVLYAKWTPNKYTIKFNKNATGTMKSMTNCQYDKSYKLTKNAFKRTGYTFKGWTIKKNGSGKLYKNQAGVKNLVSKNKGTITLYAKWVKKK